MKSISVNGSSAVCDLLVVGGGMAGLAAAARAAELGARVVVLEKADRLGGSAALSAGILWTAPDVATLRRLDPGGDLELGAVLVAGFAPAVERIRATGAFVSERWEGQMGFGSAVRVDIAALFGAWRERIQRAGGRVLLGSPARRLLAGGGAEVAGAAAGELRAGAVLLATGGFQGDPALRDELIGAPAGSLLVRSAPGSTGDGLRMGREAGAATSAGRGFYGHLVPSPLARWDETDFLPLTQYHSSHGLLVNRLGRRFTDESLGDETSNQAVLRQPGARAVLLFDERVRAGAAASAPYPHGRVVDRVAAAEATGCRLARAGTVAELVAAVARWGVDRDGLAGSLDGWRAEPPCWAVEVQPTITFPFGGLAVDGDGRVLGRDGVPVPGLFAAGADAGGVQSARYVGGLVLGAVFGPRAAEAALSRRSGRLPPGPRPRGSPAPDPD